MKELQRIPLRVYFWLAFLLALLLRLFQLGAGPLSDAEANWALQALNLAHGGSVSLGAQPAYILLTSQLFSLLGDTNFLARFYPALAGSLLVWLPLFLRRWMGNSIWLQRSGLILAFGLAIDPGLVSLSRQVGSPMPAVAFTLLTLVSFYDRRMIWAGIFAGLALLSGPALLQGLLILAVAWGLSQLVSRKPVEPGVEAVEPGPVAAPFSAQLIRSALPAFILTLLIAGTLLLRAPQGLGALAQTLPDYLKLWFTPSAVPLLRLPASLLIYQPLALIFAIITFVRLWVGTPDEPQVRQVKLGLSLWAALAILLPLLYAGRQVGDVAWALIPLWALASLEISRSLFSEENRTTRVVAVCLAAVLFVMAVVGWINLLAIGRYQLNVLLYWAVIIGAFVLGLIAVLLVAAGWSINAARVGMVASACAVLGLLLLANTIGMTIVHQNSAQELWSVSPTTGQADLLLTTLTDLSMWNTGLRDQLEIAVLDSSSSLQWALRHFPNTRFLTALSSAEAPPVVITQQSAETPTLAQKYRGQDFAWSLSPGWQGVLPPDLINWLAFRNAPLSQAQVILWARVDVFPGGTPGTSGTSGTSGASSSAGNESP